MSKIVDPVDQLVDEIYVHFVDNYSATFPSRQKNLPIGDHIRFILKHFFNDLNEGFRSIDLEKLCLDALFIIRQHLVNVKEGIRISSTNNPEELKEVLSKNFKFKHGFRSSTTFSNFSR